LRQIYTDPALTLAPPFRPGVKVYRAEVSFETVTVRIRAEPQSPGCRVHVDGPRGPRTVTYPVGLGDNTVRVLVTDDRGPQPVVVATYTLSLRRENRPGLPAFGNHRTCSFLQDCGLLVQPRQPCGLQPFRPQSPRHTCSSGHAPGPEAPPPSSRLSACLTGSHLSQVSGWFRVSAVLTTGRVIGGRLPGNQPAVCTRRWSAPCCRSVWPTGSSGWRGSRDPPSGRRCCSCCAGERPPPDTSPPPERRSDGGGSPLKVQTSAQLRPDGAGGGRSPVARHQSPEDHPGGAQQVMTRTWGGRPAGGEVTQAPPTGLPQAEVQQLHAENLKIIQAAEEQGYEVTFSSLTKSTSTTSTNTRTGTNGTGVGTIGQSDTEQEAWPKASSYHNFFKRHQTGTSLWFRPADGGSDPELLSRFWSGPSRVGTGRTAGSWSSPVSLVVFSRSGLRVLVTPAAQDTPQVRSPAPVLPSVGLSDWLSPVPGQWVVPCLSCSDNRTCDWREVAWQPTGCVHPPVERPLLQECLANRKVSSGWRGSRDTTFRQALLQLLRRSRPLLSSAQTVLVVGGVQWLDTSHLRTIQEVLSRRWRRSWWWSRPWGMGFHLPADGLRSLALAEVQQLHAENLKIIQAAEEQGYEVVDTFSITMGRPREFLQGRCACHFHEVTFSSLTKSTSTTSTNTRTGTNGTGVGTIGQSDTEQEAWPKASSYHVRGAVNQVYSEILLSRLCP
ncbi:unnamed protein product, partial [Tetraodon nigroviridis]